MIAKDKKEIIVHLQKKVYISNISDNIQVK